MKELIQYDLEAWQGEWLIVKQYDTREEAEAECKFRTKFEGIKHRVVERKYKVMFERR